MEALFQTFNSLSPTTFLRPLKLLVHFLKTQNGLKLISPRHHLCHALAMIVQRLLRVTTRLPHRTCRPRHPRQRLVRYLLLQTRQPRRQLLLLFNRPHLQGIHQGELTRRQLAESAGPRAAEELGELGLEVGPAQRVNEPDEDGGPAPRDPQEGVLERGAPGGREEGGDVSPSERASPFDVVLVVLDVFLGELTQFGAVGRVIRA